MGDLGRVDGTMTLQQSNIYIASGTKILVSGYVRPTRGPKNKGSAPFVFTLNFDNTLIGTYKPPNDSAYVTDGKGTGYIQLSKTIVVSGNGPHKLSLLIETKGTDDTFIYDADDFSIKVVAPPVGQQLCATSTGSLR
jgi:hypothetical protein